MNLAEISIKKSTITWTLTVVCLVIGYIAYTGLPRLEDPEFAIKEAVVRTPYPGASPEEVEKEVTEKIEKAIQQLGQLKRVESYSEAGASIVRVVIKDNYTMDMLPSVWDELRRKILDVTPDLPPGAGPPMVLDDFGDVYGVYFALYGEGYSFAELKDVAEMLQRELLTVTDVKKVVFMGMQTEAVYVEMSKTKMASLGITREEIFDALTAKNIPADAGDMKIGSEYMRIYPTGVFESEKDFGDLFISSKGGRLIYLKDVATVTRDYIDPPKQLLRFNGHRSIGIGISTVQGGNAVVMGEGVEKRVRQLQQQIPVGMELGVIALQSESVTLAINSFIISLLEAVLIVIVVLLFAMGLKSGLIIGFVLVVTIAGTFVVMGAYNITLERISLGALIIALGMLVDNAIVIVEGMKVKIEGGMDGAQAAKEVAAQNAMPLLGATAVAVLAFASIGAMENQTGEFCRSLYYVILISLSLSWLTAMTTTPLMVKMMMKPKKVAAGAEMEKKDPYAGKMYVAYRALVTKAIKFKWVTLGIVLGLFVAALIGFGFLDQMFFPPSPRPQFIIECHFREGTHIYETEKKVEQIEKYFEGVEGVTDVMPAIGGGHSRFVLVYDVPVDASNQYANIIVGVEDVKIVDEIFQKVQFDLESMFPDANINVKKFLLGPGKGGKIQLRINGPDPAVLRELSDRAMAILRTAEDSKAVRSEWGEPVKVIRPIMAEDTARRLGISRPMVATALQSNFRGTTTGFYREGINLIPIVARAPEDERTTIENMRDIQIFSPSAQTMVPLRQVVDGIETEIENSRISRWHRRSMLRVHADARFGLPSQLMARVKAPIELALGVDTEQYLGKEVPPEKYTASTIPVKYDDIIPLKGMPGYFISWSGEAEDSADSTAKLGASIPIYFGMMILVVILLFNAFKQPAIIWLTVPLSVIGVTAGLLIFGQPFGFMALLGLMSLAGMLIKNAIVLIDQIDLEIKEGKPPLLSVIDSGVSRMRPVSMAALTTIMGMIPLLQDKFFVSMAVTIMFGLGFATLLTLVVVPVLYTVFFKIKFTEQLLSDGAAEGAK